MNLRIYKLVFREPSELMDFPSSSISLCRYHRALAAVCKAVSSVATASFT